MSKAETRRRVLILTTRNDPHSIVVAAGLRAKGTEPILWYTADFPQLQTASLHLGCGGPTWEVGSLGLESDDRTSSTIWVRRPEAPNLRGNVAPEDRNFVLQESKLFLNGLYRQLGAAAFWVNPPLSWGRSNLKTEQLIAAELAGFKIPRTLVSNDPARIREFVRRSGGAVIFKSLTPASWQIEGGFAILFSTLLEGKDIPDDETLQMTPGIFQERIEKAYELRVTAIGNWLFAVKLRSQEVPSAEIDWRAATERVPMEPVELPPKIVEACRGVLSEMGLVFGCFDLIVTPEDDYVFLEVNEMGAFLWLEEQLPDLRLLDSFCEFLLQGTSGFQWRESADSVRFADIAGEIPAHRTPES